MKRKSLAAFAGAIIIAFCTMLGGCDAHTDPNSGSSVTSADSSTSDTSVSTSESTGGTSGTTTGATTSDTTSDTTTSQTTTSVTTTTNTTTPAPATDPPKTDPPATDPPKTDKQPIGTSPSYVPTATASGTKVNKNDNFTIDYSNANDGYVMVKLNKASGGTYKVIVQVAGAQYVYNLDSGGEYAIIPMTQGNNTYTIFAGEVISNGSLGNYLSQEVSVTLSDSLSPWLMPNAYCMYNANSKCVKKASELCGGFTELEKVEAIYKFVINNTYYQPTAESSADGYVPDPDRTLSNGWGICFDYSSLMAAMLRSQKIPTKIVVGWAGSTYHAWLSVYIIGQGWVDGIIRFDGNTWTRMDPTFLDDAYGTSNYQSMVDYVANSGNYTDIYYY
ncbi:MAG: transglutaminase domain-containing protein [Eubacterium sp.]|nr:transglutaminase domain-containing protein [Eubacterium sp.]